MTVFFVNLCKKWCEEYLFPVLLERDPILLPIIESQLTAYMVAYLWQERLTTTSVQNNKSLNNLYVLYEKNMNNNQYIKATYIFVI